MTVFQATSDCSFLLNPQNNTVDAAGGAFSTAVTAGPCVYSPAAAPSWITVNPAAVGGDQPLPYNVGANAGPLARRGAIMVGGVVAQILQKSPNAPQAFTDVPLSDPFFYDIALLKNGAITSGCTATTYCPGDSTLRSQMAVFIIRALMGDTFDFPSTPFTDVPESHPHFKYVQKLRQLGITAGCSTTEYCPNAPVTRSQMAVFIVRARYGLTATDSFPFPATPFFTDVPPADPYFGYIQKMKQRGITQGCTAATYCSADPNTRGQMAVFIERGLLTP